MRVLLVRHTRTDAPPGTCYGRLDLGLADDPAEIRRCAASLPLDGFGRVLTSPAQRCRLLADVIAARLGTAAAADPRLLELDFGAWEGRAWDGIDRGELDTWAASPMTTPPPGGETGAALIARVRAAADAIRREAADCVVVAHGGPLKVLRAILANEPPDLMAAAPPLGSAVLLEVQPAQTAATAETAAHSAVTAVAPSTSPV